MAPSSKSLEDRSDATRAPEEGLALAVVQVQSSSKRDDGYGGCPC